MLNEHDTWNKELDEFFSDQSNAGISIKFFRENLRLGRAGLHEYFNELYKHATGQWIIYFCEDHFITMNNWDSYVLSVIMGGSRSLALQTEHGKERDEMNYLDVWCLIPKFDNCGAMNQILSRGYCEALGGRLARHGWLDSYINDLNEAIPDRVIMLDDEMFHDFTHDQPNPMADSEVQALSTDKGNALPDFKSTVVEHRIEVDREKLVRAVERGAR